MGIAAPTPRVCNTLPTLKRDYRVVREQWNERGAAHICSMTSARMYFRVYCFLRGLPFYNTCVHVGRPLLLSCGPGVFPLAGW